MVEGIDSAGAGPSGTGTSGGAFRPYRAERFDGGGHDPFDTAGLRRAVLDAWTASPARFREDANAEEDLALGGYRDRLVVELAQNAADAAHRAAVPGRLRLTLRDGVLVAANTGAPPDAAGVASLSTLRASAKRDDAPGAVGRFGVGFAAVLAVTDTPAVLSRSGGVRWSLAEARELAAAAAEPPAAAPGLAEELRRRDGHVPLLRLPLPAEGTPPDGYDTAVVLPLRDGAAADLAARLLAGVDDALLLALPGLAELTVETPGTVRTLRLHRHADAADPSDPAGTGDDAGFGTVRIEETVRAGAAGDARGAEETAPDAAAADGHREVRRWQVVERGGELDPALLADRPVEERQRPRWSVTWALPVDADGAPVPPATAPVLHAPTPTDEPQQLPALLIAALPLDPARRHTAPGPAADHVLARAAEAYAELLRHRPPGEDNLALVPDPVGHGPVDGALRTAVLEALPRVPFLPAAQPSRPPRGDEADGGDGPRRLRPDQAVVLDGAGAELVGVLAEVVSGLLPAGLERHRALRTLGVRRLALGELVDSLAGLDREPGWWHRLYTGLAGADPEALGSLPVPLADGRTATGPRRVLLWDPALGTPAPAARDGGPDAEPAEPDAEPDAERDGAPSTAPDLTVLDLRIAHPDATHPLLERLGAARATPAAVLASPQTRAAVARSLDTDDAEAEEIADAVLHLARAADARPGDHPWLAALALTDDYGDPAPAGELVLPGSPLADLLDAEEAGRVDTALAERWGAAPLLAVGVAAEPVLLGAADVVLDPDDPDALELPVHPAPPDGDPGPATAPDAVDTWCDDVLDQLPEEPDGAPGVPPIAAELLAVRDLDLIRDDAWPRALHLLAAPPLRDAVTRPVRVLLPDGRHADVPPYTAWWLRDHPVLDGRRPADLRAPGSDPLLHGLYDDARTPLDEAFLHALGVRTSLRALLDAPDGPADLLERLADPGRSVTPAQLRALYDALAAADPERVPRPARLRVLTPDGGGTTVADAADVVVADAPDLLPLLAGRPLLPADPGLAGDLADLLGAVTAEEAAGGRVAEPGERHPVPEVLRALLPEAPEEYEEHEALEIDGPDGSRAELDWRFDPDTGRLHAATVDGLAWGAAWAAGRWTRRFEAAALLADPDRAAELAAERIFE